METLDIQVSSRKSVVENAANRCELKVLLLSSHMLISSPGP